MARLLGVQKTGEKGNKHILQAVFLGFPTSEDLRKAQIRAGFHPAEHGEPGKNNITPRGDKYEATFECRK